MGALYYAGLMALSLGIAGCEGETVTRRDFQSLEQRVKLLESEVHRLKVAEANRKKAEGENARGAQVVAHAVGLPQEPSVSGQPPEVPQPIAGGSPPDLDKILREARDEMFGRILGEGVERENDPPAKLIDYLLTAPRYLTFEEGKRKAGPLDYMFRAIPGIWGRDLSNITDALVEAYKKRVVERCGELGVKLDERNRGKLRREGITLSFYDLIRNPSDEHLRQIYRFVSSPTIPRFLKDLMTSQQVGDAMTKAQDLLRKQEAGTLRFFQITYDHPDPTNPNDQRKPDDIREVWEPIHGLGRAYNGELVGLEGYGWEVKFGKQEERTLSSFTRWLFRRGPDFVDSMRAMVSAYKENTTEEQFVLNYHKHTGTPAPSEPSPATTAPISLPDLPRDR